MTNVDFFNPTQVGSGLQWRIDDSEFWVQVTLNDDFIIVESFVDHPENGWSPKSEGYPVDGMSMETQLFKVGYLFSCEMEDCRAALA